MGLKAMILFINLFSNPRILIHLHAKTLKNDTKKTNAIHCFYGLCKCNCTAKK